MKKMTHQEMREALRTGFNRQGRTLSDAMRMKYLIALEPPKNPKTFAPIEYRGMTISGTVGDYTVTQNGRFWQRNFTSVQKTKDAIDYCLKIREEVEAAS